MQCFSDLFQAPTLMMPTEEPSLVATPAALAAAARAAAGPLWRMATSSVLRFLRAPARTGFGMWVGPDCSCPQPKHALRQQAACQPKQADPHGTTRLPFQKGHLPAATEAVAMLS